MAPFGIMHTGADRKILDVNPKLCEILGYTREELLAMTPADLLQPEYREADRPLYMQQMLRGEMQTFSSQRPYIRKYGSVVWTNRSSSLVRDAAGEPLYFLRMIEDISERKRVEDALAQERQLLRTVVDAIPDRIYVKDVEGRFILQNATNLKVRGFEHREDIIGKTVFDWQYYWVDLFGLSLYDKLYRQLTNPETDEIKQAFRSVTKGDRAFTDRHGWDDGYGDYINGENPGAGPWSRRRLIVAGMWLSC